MNITEYSFITGKLSRPVRLAVVCDLHNRRVPGLLDDISGADCLLIPGDIVNRFTQRWEVGAEFLAMAAKRLPTFFSPGNHETRLKNSNAFFAAARASGASILYNEYAVFGELAIAGWYLPGEDSAMLAEFESLPLCRVLMCHKPNHYMQYLKNADIDLALSGHAHGGHIRVFDRGLYAPGQGFFPKYTKGIVDDRLIICAGAVNTLPLPRWGNPCEALMIALR